MCSITEPVVLIIEILKEITVLLIYPKTNRCASIKFFHWIGTEFRDPLIYDGTSNVEDFMDAMEYKVGEEQRVSTLDVVLRDWWTTDK